MRDLVNRWMLLAASICALMSVGCEDPTVSSPAPQERVFTVTLLSQTSGPIAGANVSIPLNGTQYALKTNARGQGAFHIPNSVALPAFVIAVIDHSSIMPEAVSFPGEVNGRYSRNYTCRSAPLRIYHKECTLHHLGNDLYGGAPNSQLQLPTEGLELARSFYLNVIPSRMPRIRLFARGIQNPTEIRINGAVLGRLGDSDADGDLSLYDFQLNGYPASLLKIGSNQLSIRTGATGLSNDPWDDIEFCSVALYLE